MVSITSDSKTLSFLDVEEGLMYFADSQTHGLSWKQLYQII